jgi:hypothetical protein
MKRSLARKSIVFCVGGMPAAGLMSTAYGATAANAASIANAASVTQAQAPAQAHAPAHGPSWHTILSVPNGTKSNLVDTVIASGKTSGAVSRIPGTAAALAGGVQYGTGHGTSVVFQYS